jgi:hypothetical protein
MMAIVGHAPAILALAGCPSFPLIANPDAWVRRNNGEVVAEFDGNHRVHQLTLVVGEFSAESGPVAEEELHKIPLSNRCTIRTALLVRAINRIRRQMYRDGRLSPWDICVTLRLFGEEPGLRIALACGWAALREWERTRRQARERVETESEDGLIEVAEGEATPWTDEPLRAVLDIAERARMSKADHQRRMDELGRVGRHLTAAQAFDEQVSARSPREIVQSIYGIAVQAPDHRDERAVVDVIHDTIEYLPFELGLLLIEKEEWLLDNVIRPPFVRWALGLVPLAG